MWYILCGILYELRIVCSIEIRIFFQIFEPSDSVMNDIWSSSKNITDDDTCLRVVFDKIYVWNEILVTVEILVITIFVANINFIFEHKDSV